MKKRIKKKERKYDDDNSQIYRIVGKEKWRQEIKIKSSICKN